MTDIRACIADALREELSWTALESVNPVKLADVLLSLPGIAITQLPPLMGDRSVVAESIRDRPMWTVNDAWASLSDEGEIELEANSQMLYGTLKNAQDALDLAAVLLAAAVQAQKEQQ